MTEKDIKLLWGRAANRCSFCRLELSHDPKENSASFVLGEQAHIVGEKETAARGISILTLKERNRYHNLILLCPTHHTEIDKNEADWPIESLHLKKSAHELWVKETLASDSDLKLVAQQVVVTNIIDSAVELCRLESWQNWTSNALAADPSWELEMPDNSMEFCLRVARAIWPVEFDELKRAAIRLSIKLKSASDEFMKHSIMSNGRYLPDKFYRNNGFNPNYDADSKKYRDWLDTCNALVIEATRAANWFADVVRRDVNPMFFAAKGKFFVTKGPDCNSVFHSIIPEYSDEQKQ